MAQNHKKTNPTATRTRGSVYGVFSTTELDKHVVDKLDVLCFNSGLTPTQLLQTLLDDFTRHHTR